MNVKIIGIGGCGTWALESILNIGFDPENAIFMDTTTNARSIVSSDNFIQLGKSIFKGLGTGNDPNGGRVAAEMTEGEIVEAMKGADTVILLAGLAGGAGAGALPFIASLALDYIEAKTIAYVTLPAEIEGNGRMAKAETALSNLRTVLDEENIHVINTAPGTLATMFDNTDKLVAEKVKELLGDSFFQRRKRVFLGGSKSITELTDDEKAVIDEYITKDYQILVGDCRGADTEIQKHLVAREYKNVKVYATDGEVRNNVGNFKLIDCQSMRSPKARAMKDYYYYRVKDERMLTLCDEILMFWDGNSKASRDNLEEGLIMQKPTKAVLSPFEVKEIKIDEDIENIVGDIALMNVLGVDGELLEDLRKYLSSLADSGKEITYDKISLWIKKEKIKLKMNQCEKPQAWYEILISDHFIDYVKSDPDYETDFEIENSVINQFWSVVDGLSCGSSMRIIGNCGEDDLPNCGEWFLKGALAYLKDEYNEKDTSVIAKSIREIDERNNFDHDPNILSEVQLAFLIMWITWNRPCHECMLYEFTIGGGLKKYLLALEKDMKKQPKTSRQELFYER